MNLKVNIIVAIKSLVDNYIYFKMVENFLTMGILLQALFD